MLHIISAKLTKRIGDKDTCKIKVDIKMPFGKRGSSEQQIIVVYNQDIRVNTYEVFSFSNQKVFLPKFRDCSLVLEIFDDSDNFLGLSMFSLNNFFEAFSFEQPPKYLFPDKEEPVIGHYGSFTSTNPITDEVVLEMNCVLAFGTEAQVKGFVNSQRAAMTIQDFVRSSLSKSKDKNHVEEYSQDEEYDTQHENSTKPLSSTDQTRPKQKLKIAHNGVERDYEDPEIVFEEQANRKEEIPSEHSPRIPQIPKCIPLPVLSSLFIRVNRASGLKDAAIKCGTYNSHMRAASQVGVNPFVEFEDISSGKQIQTPVLASTFCPVWDYEYVTEFLLDEAMYHNVNHGELVFCVFHRIPQSRITSNSASSTVELGKVMVPLRTLLSNNQGISGWFDIHSHDDTVVGTIDLEVFFDDQTVRSLFVNDPKKKVLRQPYPYPICRFTLIIEETNIPTQVLEELVPFYMLEENQSIPCYLFVTYRFYGEQNFTESRHYKSSTSISKTIMHHSCEFKKVLDPNLKNTIEQEKLAIHVYCSVDNGRDQNETSIRKRAKLIGSAYVDINNLIAHSDSSKTLFISGLYNIVNTESDILNHGNVKIKVSSERINFGVSATMNTLHQKPHIRSSGTQANIDISLQSDDECCSSNDTKQENLIKEPEMTLEEKELQIAQDDDVLIKQPKTPSRKRVAIETTFSPNQSLISNLVEEQSVVESPLLLDMSKRPLNYLNISIEEAKLTKIFHFHGIKPVNPSPYVKIISPNQQTHEQSEDKAVVTSVVPNENGLMPSWNERFRVPIYSQIEFVSLQVWSRNQDQFGPTLDTLIGFAKVDISSLWYGLRIIDGWYNIEDVEKSKIVGQIKIAISLDSPTKVSSPQIRHSSEMVKAERFMMKSFDKHIMTITNSQPPSLQQQPEENFCGDLVAPNDLFYSSIDLENEKAKLKNCLSDLENMINNH